MASPIVGVFKREKGNYFRFDPGQWQLALLFDGVRSYQEIAEEFTANTGAPMGPADVQSFADTLEDAGFWFKSPQEKNIAMNQKLIGQRERRAARKSKVSLAYIGFSAWDPDRYLTWLDGRIGKYIYSPWFALFAVLLFCFEASDLSLPIGASSVPTSHSTSTSFTRRCPTWCSSGYWSSLWAYP